MKTVSMAPPAEKKSIVEPGVNGVADSATNRIAGKLNLMDVLKSDEVGKYVNAFLNPLLIFISAALIALMLADLRADIKELNTRAEQAQSRSTINASRMDYLQGEIQELKAEIRDLQKK